ncbi:MAG: secondary thiamine-phosphate synthase enzyme YjbQ [Deltaproteobacteria bacterium]|nr:secondary thiamine-phosphate synthase enzyme YjbQ [Deltaproteobacteria bacterium]
MVNTAQVTLETRGNAQILDITPHLHDALEDLDVTEGVLHVFLPGSTAALTTIEAEPGAIADLRAAIERLAPADIPYKHNETAHDDNGHSHVRAALIGPSLTIPISEGALVLGAWQQAVLIDFDTEPRTRTLVCTAVGE